MVATSASNTSGSINNALYNSGGEMENSKENEVINSIDDKTTYTLTDQNGKSFQFNPDFIQDLGDGYTLMVAADDNRAVIIDQEGNTVNIWSDKHLSRADADGSKNGTFDFRHNMTFVIPNGTKITFDSSGENTAIHIFDEEGIEDSDGTKKATLTEFTFGSQTNKNILLLYTPHEGDQAVTKEKGTYDGVEAKVSGSLTDLSFYDDIHGDYDGYDPFAASGDKNDKKAEIGLPNTYKEAANIILHDYGKFDLSGTGQGLLTKSGLKRVAEDTSLPPHIREAARLIASNPSLFSRIDNIDGGGRDQKISPSDLQSFIWTPIDRGDAANQIHYHFNDLDHKNDWLSRKDGWISRGDLDAAIRDSDLPAHVRLACRLFLDSGAFDHLKNGKGHVHKDQLQPYRNTDHGKGALHSGPTNGQEAGKVILDNFDRYDKGAGIGRLDDWISDKDLTAIAKDEDQPWHVRQAAEMVLADLGKINGDSKKFKREHLISYMSTEHAQEDRSSHNLTEKIERNDAGTGSGQTRNANREAPILRGVFDIDEVKGIMTDLGVDLDGASIMLVLFVIFQQRQENIQDYLKVQVESISSDNDMMKQVNTLLTSLIGADTNPDGEGSHKIELTEPEYNFMVDYGIINPDDKRKDKDGNEIDPVTPHGDGYLAEVKYVKQALSAKAEELQNMTNKSQQKMQYTSGNLNSTSEAIYSFVESFTRTLKSGASKIAP